MGQALLLYSTRLQIISSLSLGFRWANRRWESGRTQREILTVDRVRGPDLRKPRSTMTTSSAWASTHAAGPGRLTAPAPCCGWSRKRTGMRWNFSKEPLTRIELLKEFRMDGIGFLHFAPVVFC